MLYPKIGIPRLGKDPLSRLLEYQYERCLRRAGASLWILVHQATEEYIQTALQTCDGFCFRVRMLWMQSSTIRLPWPGDRQILCGMSLR